MELRRRRWHVPPPVSKISPVEKNNLRRTIINIKTKVSVKQGFALLKWSAHADRLST
jgi:hypothetical protein